MDQSTREDVFIGRIAANEADQSEWETFEQHAATEPRAWERLARSLRDELQVRAAFASQVASAEQVEIPAKAFAPPVLARLRAWPGWAAAAVIALAWAAGLQLPLTLSQNPPAAASPGIVRPAFDSPDDVLNEYVRLGSEQGRVLQELPMVMIESRPVEDEKGLEILYVRQLLERARVESAWQLNRDELGRRTPVPIELASFQKERGI